MAVSGTVPARAQNRVDPMAVAAWVRRGTLGVAVLAFVWCFIKVGSERVPANMDTVPSAPPGSWCLVDRFASGLHVGSDVFVETPAGRLLSRVASLDADSVTVLHPSRTKAWPDSTQFGPLPRQCVLSSVMVVFPPAVSPPSGGTANGR